VIFRQKSGKVQIQQSKDGYYFYNALEYFIDVYAKGMDSLAVFSKIKED
jgi:hypothetical protein